MDFSYCPRCNGKSYEHLATHSYCVNCNYSPTTDEKYDYAIPQWALEFLKEGNSVDEAALLPLGPLVGFVSKETPKTANLGPTKGLPDSFLSEAI